MTDYERDIDAEVKDMFYNRVKEVAREALKTTSTRIRVKYIDPITKKMEEHDTKIQEHDGLLGGLFRQMTSSFGGLMKLDEKLKGKK